MSTLRPVVTDDYGARVLVGVIGSANVDSTSPAKGGEHANGNPVICAQATEFPTEDPDGTVKTRTLHRLSGAEWVDTQQAMPIRRISNGRQIAWPVGRHGMCVQDPAFWAVNIGALAAATHPLTGHSAGVAGVFASKTDGDLEITNGRLAFVRRDASGTIADGTLIQLAYVSGTLTIVWADCQPHEDLEGLEAEPA